jgi:hypothetical protein
MKCSSEKCDKKGIYIHTHTCFYGFCLKIRMNATGKYTCTLYHSHFQDNNYLYDLFVLQIVKLCYTCGYMVFNATFNHISALSWWSVLFVEETGATGENH